MSRVSDAGKRVSAEYNMHRVADPHGSIGKWFAVKLTDGSTDHVLYDNRAECIRHQHHNEQYYAYVQIGPWQMSPMDAQTFMRKHREMYSAGIRLVDPDATGGGKSIIKRLTKYDEARQHRSMIIGDVTPSNISFGGN